MLRCFNYVQVDQQPSNKYPNRTKIILFDYLNKYEIVSTWDTMTDTAKVIIPKNMDAKDLQGNPIVLQGSNKDLGFGDNALFMKGDKISIQAGYWYLDELGQQRQYVRLLFEGFITKVHSKLAITLECEDCAYLLKQIPTPDKMWGKSQSLQDIISECIKGTDFEKAGGTVKTQSNTKVEFNIGSFYTKGETVAQVLSRIKRDFKINSYLKGYEIRIGYPTYWPQDVQNHLKPFKFIFQQNIISDDLVYMRKDDVIMSATAQSFYEVDTTFKTLDGETKTEKKKLMVFVWVDPKTQTFKHKQIIDTKDIPANQAGERYTFFFPFSKTITDLKNQAINELQKKYYTGFRGSFTTFGMPFIPYGDNIKIEDKVLTDKNGTYKVKSVTYTGGIGIGIRQQIFLDYKIDV